MSRVEQGCTGRQTASNRTGLDPILRELAALPSDWRLVRVGRDKAPIAGPDWFDADNYSPDDAAALNGSSPPAWGLKSGPVSGVLVLDLDAKGWRESFQQVTGRSIDELPRTISWTSGKRGRSGSAYQVDPEWWPHLANRRHWFNESGETCWELRWDRHQAVIIGAHPETGAYRWIRGRSPHDIPDPAPAPDWLLDALLVQELPEVAAIKPTAADARRAVAMLQTLPAEQFSAYDDWLRVGMALHHTDPGLLAEWVDWCRSMANFDEAECLAKWQSFGKAHKGRPATIATLHHLAKQHGYQEPRTSRAPNTAPAAPATKAPASLQALIQRLKDGWNEDGKSTVLSPGRLAEMLPAQRFRFNELDLRAYVETSAGWQRITDADLDSAYVLLTGKGWRIGADPVVKAVLHVARQTSVHPVRDYLQRVKADPSIKPFDLDDVAAKLFRASDPLYVAMVRKWLIGAVARALAPGCQMDYCLVLKGGQGLLKSTSLKALAGGEWFTSSHADQEKDFLLNVHSCWIYELAELETITGRKQAGALKNLITTAADSFRPPYGRTVERLDRQSVFCGTVNKDQFLRDDTGNRRYWVVPINGTEQLNRDAIVAARDGIWKAAVLAHEAGELPMLPAHLEALSAAQNEQFNEQDAWVGMVQAWMDGEAMHRWDADRDPSTTSYEEGGAFTSAEILYSAGLKRPDAITRADEMRLGEVLRGLGFTRDKNPTRTPFSSGRVRCWRRPAQPAQPGTTSNPEVVPAETRSAAVGLPTPAQPAQPKTVFGRLKAEEPSSPARRRSSSTSQDAREVVQVVPPRETRSAAVGLPGTTSNPEVVQVVPGCAATPRFIDPSPAPIGSGADAMGEEDDPAWGPRAEDVA
jgi:hypothetical protein